jgi:hypothetical protein
VKKNLLVFLFLIVLSLALVSCEFSVSTASISSAKMSTDNTGATETAVYKADATFYDVVVLANAPDSTKVKAVWYKVDGTATTQFVEKEIVGSGSPIIFNATNANPWPSGKYKVELYLNDKLDRTQEFSVE